jgi:HSP20 family molecular chaperone IbpA
MDGIWRALRSCEIRAASAGYQENFVLISHYITHSQRYARSRNIENDIDAVDVDKIVAELPGMDEKNIEVKIANSMLTIKGEKQEEKEEEKQDYYVRERSFGSFERTFPMPDGVDLDKVDASFKKGVLTVTLPKTAETQKAEKKITVKAE